MEVWNQPPLQPVTASRLPIQYPRHLTPHTVAPAAKPLACMLFKTRQLSSPSARVSHDTDRRATCHSPAFAPSFGCFGAWLRPCVEPVAGSGALPWPTNLWTVHLYLQSTPRSSSPFHFYLSQSSSIARAATVDTQVPGTPLLTPTVPPKSG